MFFLFIIANVVCLVMMELSAFPAKYFELSCFTYMYLSFRDRAMTITIIRDFSASASVRFSLSQLMLLNPINWNVFDYVFTMQYV